MSPTSSFVFKTHCDSGRALLREAGSFFAMRLVSLGMETVLMFLLVEMLHLNDLAMKLLVNIVVIILNYVFSKLFILRRNKRKTQTHTPREGRNMKPIRLFAAFFFCMDDADSRRGRGGYYRYQARREHGRRAG